jgi:DNA-directed RNA polymerase subunit RPC12/RpoP
MSDTSVSYKCPCCGAPLSFQPGHDKVSCEYCSNEFEVKTIEKLYEQQQNLAAKTAKAQSQGGWKTGDAGTDWDEQEAADLKVFTCESCGAEIVANENTIATECCYCGNPTLLPQRFGGMLKPDYVIPFQKTKKEAVAALQEFYKGKKLLPDVFTANNRMEDIQGLYVPFWLFDSQVAAMAEFKAHRSTVYDDEDETVTETSYYDCQRSGTAEFAKIPVDGSTKMDDSYMESIEPYDYSGLQPFTTAYLPGYLAEKYDVTAEDSTVRADERVDSSMLNLLGDTLENYEGYDLEDSYVHKCNGEVKYALAPVWILTTAYQKENYTFMMNGQTGKFVGKLPVDKGKLHKYQLISFVISSCSLFALSYLIFG